MKNYINKFAMFVALSTGIALAQGMPQQQNPQTAPSTPSASQPDQSVSSTPSASQPAPDQAQQPEQSTTEGKGSASSPDTMPKTDQDKSSDQSKDQSTKMPQSDTAAAASGDVQSQVQTALQQDPKLANANITVSVKGNKLELAGTVPSNDEKKLAEQIAKSHAGDLKVKNHIKIAGGNLPGQDKDKGKDKSPY